MPRIGQGQQCKVFGKGAWGQTAVLVWILVRVTHPRRFDMRDAAARRQKNAATMGHA